jgi:hypothetical protein
MLLDDFNKLRFQVLDADCCTGHLEAARVESDVHLRFAACDKRF